MKIFTTSFDPSTGQPIKLERDLDVKFCESVETQNNLPKKDNRDNDVRYIVDSNHLFCYKEGNWHDQGVCNNTNIAQGKPFRIIENELRILTLNVMLDSFRIAILGSLSLLKMVDAFVDEYEDQSGIDLTNSIDQSYNSTLDAYSTLSSGDAYTKLLLHMDGSEFSTLFVDSSSVAKTVTAINGAKITTTQSTFGGASGTFDGIDDYLTVSDSADWDFGSGDFTVDCWVRLNDLSASSTIFSQGPDFSNEIDWSIHPTSNVARIDVYSGGSPLMRLNFDFIPTINTWYHLALVRNGNVWNMYVDGVAATKNLFAGSYSITIPNYTSNLYIGTAINGAYWFKGQMDEVRISKGIARFTSNFTPPTAQYSDLAKDITLVSLSQTALEVPTFATLIIFEEDIDNVVLNTDLKGYVSRDGGVTFTQVTLVNNGNYDSGARIISCTANISAQPSGTSMVYKITTHNAKNLNIHGTALSWK